MNDEIKEILDEFMNFDFNSQGERIEINEYERNILKDYITNLQQENEHLRTQVNIYENPDDMTLFYMWLNAKAKDKMKQLQEENERLKEKENKLQEKFKDWKKRIEKERKHYLCDRTDCCGRIKNSRKYRSLYQENERLNNENERLNNIINELEKDLIDYFKKEYADRKLEDCNLENCTYDYALVMLGKLKKLKEGKE